MLGSAQKKRDEIHRAVASAEKQKYFESVRKRMLEAQRNQIEE